MPLTQLLINSKSDLENKKELCLSNNNQNDKIQFGYHYEK